MHSTRENQKKVQQVTSRGFASRYMQFPFHNMPQIMKPYQLEIEADYLRHLYEFETGYSSFRGKKVKVDTICQWILTKYGYDYYLTENIPSPQNSEFLAFTSGQTIFGLTSFSDKEVYIQDKGVRERFCWAHETKHALHDSKFSLPELDSQELKAIETQANLFARYLLLPADKFRESWDFWKDIYGYRSTNDTDKPLISVLRGLVTELGASGFAVVLRANELGLISSETKEKILNSRVEIKSYPDMFID